MQQPLALHIVNCLRQYHSMPMGFIAKLTGRSSEEVTKYVEMLRQKGIVRVDGDEVILSEKETVSADGPGGVAGGAA